MSRLTDEELLATIEEQFRADVRARFDGVDEHFEAVDKRFDGIDERLDRTDQSFQDLKDWVEMIVGRFQTRSGRRLEDVAAGALRLALERHDSRPGQVSLRQRIEDRHGGDGTCGEELRGRYPRRG